MPYMKNNLILILPILLLLLTISCKKGKAQLMKLSVDKMCILLKEGDRSFYYAITTDSLGNALNDSLKTQLTKGKLFREFYVDGNGKVKEIRVRKLTENDIFDEIRIRCAMTFPFEQYNQIDINCDSSSTIIQKAYANDQMSRSSEEFFNNIPNVDLTNKDIVISLVEKCSLKSIDENLINQIFLVIHHIGIEYMSYYYLTFTEFYKQGLLSGRNYARMLDRLLMNSGFKQLYGTHIVKQSIFDIKDVENVNERRKQLGLNTIEEQAREFGFEFKIERHLEGND